MKCMFRMMKQLIISQAATCCCVYQNLQIPINPLISEDVYVTDISVIHCTADMQGCDMFEYYNHKMLPNALRYGYKLIGPPYLDFALSR